MAEFSGGGLLAALLLFTALTIKDVYVGMHRGHGQDQRGPRDEAEDRGRFSAGEEQSRPSKSWSSTGNLGPVLRFQYCIS
ncbi:hypothetical protein WMY93_012022 [Mugilogobius chulae]|uniref:Selenoprotein T n=1 Tax=Mugilogobius chulae TaxID=88201 RepID=A0AAW0PFM0_9GOBI